MPIIKNVYTKDERRLFQNYFRSKVSYEDPPLEAPPATRIEGKRTCKAAGGAAAPSPLTSRNGITLLFHSYIFVSLFSPLSREL